MRTSLLLLIGSALALRQAQPATDVGLAKNLATNPGFEQGISGWQERPVRGGAVTKPALDTQERHSGQQSLCVKGNLAKAGVFQAVENLPQCQAIRAHYWGRIERSPELSGASLAIGVDLGVTLDSGHIDWFLPESLRLGERDVGRWVEKWSWYHVPEGRKIRSITIHCINYKNSGRVWFDDVEVVPMQIDPTASEICVVQPMTERGQQNWASIKPKLGSAGHPFSQIPPLTLPAQCKLLILPEFPDSDQLYRWVRNRFYADGMTIIGCGFANSKYADAIRRFIWSEARPKIVVTTPDDRAAYYPSVDRFPDDMGSVIDGILASEEQMPEAIDALQFAKYRRAELRDASLWLDGQPCFLRAMGAYYVRAREAYERDLAQYRTMGLNGIVAYVGPDMPEDDFSHFLDTAEQNGLMVIVWFSIRRPVRESGGIPWRIEWLQRFFKCRRHPALLSWLMSDDTSDKHYPVIRKIRDLIERYDDDNFATATSFGFRHAERITPASWERWKGVMDYPTTYDYPLNKDNKLWKANLCVGLEDIQRLAENVPRVYGRETYFHLWAQSHLQGHVTRSLGLAGAEQFLPSPEQTRLLTYMMIASGARGILYFHAGAFADERLGIGRRNELALVWHELAPFEELIAAGRRQQALSVSRPDVEAVTFSRDGDTLLMLIKHGKQYHRYVSEGHVDGVTVKLRLEAAPTLKAWRVGYPQVAALEVAAEGDDVLSLQVSDIDLTAIILISSDAKTADVAAKQRSTTRAAATRFAYAVCRDKKIKTQAALDRIAEAGGTVGADVTASMEQADQQFGQATQRYQGLRDLLEAYRDVQARMVARAESIWAERKSPTEAEKFLNMYFTLPSFYSVLNGGSPLKRGELGRYIKQKLMTRE